MFIEMVKDGTIQLSNLEITWLYLIIIGVLLSVIMAVWIVVDAIRKSTIEQQNDFCSYKKEPTDE